MVSSNININGYYYTEIDSSSDKTIEVKILLDQGAFRQLDRVRANSSNEYFNQYCNVNQRNTLACAIENFECMLNNYEHFYLVKTNFFNSGAKKWNWGKYTIKGNRISIWYYYNFHGHYYKEEEKGLIIDSQSFIIESVYDQRTNESQPAKLLYRFKPYKVDGILKYKPDM